MRRAATKQMNRRPRTRERLITRFHQLYFNCKDQTWKKNTFWLSVPVAKCPLDLWVYQEIIGETLPDLIIESGTAFGGSALFLASVCDLVDHGRIVTVDVVAQPNRPVHKRITYISGSSVEEKTVEGIKISIRDGERVMVILDSDHHAAHVAKELAAYAPVVSAGCYLIVEDTNINGNPVLPDFGEGPREAVDQFLNSNPGFERDLSREKFFLTFNPGGYLRRLK